MNVPGAPVRNSGVSSLMVFMPLTSPAYIPMELLKMIELMDVARRPCRSNSSRESSMEETGTSRSLRVNASALRAIWTMGSSKWVCRRTGKMSMKLPTVLRAPAKYCSRLNTGMLMIMSS